MLQLLKISLKLLTLSTFKRQLEILFPAFQENHFLLAISGGVDSMVMAHLFLHSGLTFQIAHVNYNLRGKDSQQDQQLVEDFCKKNNIKLHLCEVSEKDHRPENSIQIWARKLRYQFFREIQKKERIDFIVTAHHLNDQLETFLINLSRSAGIKGLSGIPANENKILRPLLSFTKDEIYQFAKENNIDFREDLSNQKNDYLRNFFRNEISAKLIESDPHFLRNFSKSIDYLRQTKDFVEEKIEEIENEIISIEDQLIVLQKDGLKKQTEFVQFEILRKFGFEDSLEIEKILHAENGKTFKSKDFQLTVDRFAFYISNKENPSEEVTFTLEINSDNEIELRNYVKNIPATVNFTWTFDEEKLALPLLLRHKKDNDIFFPVGWTGNKKVSKFFRDEKIPILARQKTWLLCDSDQNILGIIPFRQDQRFVNDEKTAKILTIKM